MAGLRRVFIAVALVGVLAAMGFLAWRWSDRSRDIQVTDDAYVRGEITDISARVTGYAVEVLVDDNMPVKAGQVMVRVDPRDFHMTIEKAQAMLDQAKAALDQIGAQRELEQSKVLVAEAGLRSARAQTKNAEIVLQRATTLAADGFGTKAAVDTNTAAAARTHAEVDEAQANLDFEHEQLVVIDSNQAVARAQIASAQAALLSAKFALVDTEIWAPIDGIVANRKTLVGEYVTVGTHMMSIVPTDNLWIDANYRETQIGRMRIGDPARVSVDTYAQRPLCGYVESIAPASGSEFALIPPDNATGNFTKIARRFTVRIRFNTREAYAALARPGMSVETAVAVPTADNASATNRALRIGCAFDSGQDVSMHALTKLPEHPGLGRARPQGPAGTQISPEPAR